ncbi:Predicted arabinose efflux permease, MFS family [Georgenia satyanarayanai]|uniref:Predicted arabinose efflux permease, MFS family n=1 Tax=Georgenia satyanarayanai TaxID=860221 RepID=A0A2Y9AQG4_9MICO|nr:MFS transporter [Georgenia satyanarayanai]PYF97239.1 putative MFS family arabinose efflux permease [Georgenia satyanarayanai]SSA46325.1 Predicted arabinose efflux permease, MFS family [Georgenia satyanarayanai]
MARVVLSGMALIAATYGLARFGYGLFLPRLEESFALGPAVAGAVQAGSFLSYSGAALLASRLGAHPRAVVGVAGLTATVGSLGVALAPGAGALALSVLVAGAGAGFATPGLVSVVERNVAPERQETAQTAVNAGTGAGIVLAGALATGAGAQWRLAWVAIAVLAATATVASLRADRAPGPSGDRSLRPGRATLGRLARPIVAAVLGGASSAAVWTFGRSVMESASETGSVAAWMVLGAFGVLGAVAGPLVQAWDLRTAWMLTTGTMAASTVVLGLVPAGAPAVAAVAVFGASYTALSGVLIVWAVRTVPEASAGATVLLFVALALGQAAGAVLVGGLLGATSAVVAFSTAGAVGGVATLVVVRPRARPGADAVPVRR